MKYQKVNKSNIIYDLLLKRFKNEGFPKQLILDNEKNRFNAIMLIEKDGY
jgi:hypothetical protein